MVKAPSGSIAPPDMGFDAPPDANRYTLKELIPIALGCYPLTYARVAIPGGDVVICPAPASGYRRIVVHAYGYGDTASGQVVWKVVEPDGTQTYLGGTPLSTTGAGLEVGHASLPRAITLRPGETLNAEDITGGGNVDGGCGYVDVLA